MALRSMCFHMILRGCGRPSARGAVMYSKLRARRKEHTPRRSEVDPLKTWAASRAGSRPQHPRGGGGRESTTRPRGSAGGWSRCGRRNIPVQRRPSRRGSAANKHGQDEAEQHTENAENHRSRAQAFAALVESRANVGVPMAWKRARAHRGVAQRERSRAGRRRGRLKDTPFETLAPGGSHLLTVPLSVGVADRSQKGGRISLRNLRLLESPFITARKPPNFNSG